MSKELMEWLGLTGADGLTYLGLSSAFASYFVSNIPMDLFLLGTGLILTLTACLVGMKADAELSRFTNTMKMISYPIWVLAVVTMGILNFTRWN
jgi:hypothetical protein